MATSLLDNMTVEEIFAEERPHTLDILAHAEFLGATAGQIANEPVAPLVSDFSATAKRILPILYTEFLVTMGTIPPAGLVQHVSLALKPTGEVIGYAGIHDLDPRHLPKLIIKAGLYARKALKERRAKMAHVPS